MLAMEQRSNCAIVKSVDLQTEDIAQSGENRDDGWDGIALAAWRTRRFLQI